MKKKRKIIAFCSALLQAKASTGKFVIPLILSEEREKVKNIYAFFLFVIDTSINEYWEMFAVIGTIRRAMADEKREENICVLFGIDTGKRVMLLILLWELVVSIGGDFLCNIRVAVRNK